MYRPPPLAFHQSASAANSFGSAQVRAAQPLQAASVRAQLLVGGIMHSGPTTTHQSTVTPKAEDAFDDPQNFYDKKVY